MTSTERIAVPPLALELSWQDGQIEEIRLGWSSKAYSPAHPSPEATRLVETLSHYVRGEKVVWPDLPLCWERLSPFSRCVLRTLQGHIGWGEWISYSGLAKRCGNPRAARAVGAVMRANPWPLVVPCHRVLGKQGDLTGFGGGLALKKLLLDLEGTFGSCES